MSENESQEERSGRPSPRDYPTAEEIINRPFEPDSDALPKERWKDRVPDAPK